MGRAYPDRRSAPTRPSSTGYGAKPSIAVEPGHHDHDHDSVTDYRGSFLVGGNYFFIVNLPLS
jgi:hypothetical protein